MTTCRHCEMQNQITRHGSVWRGWLGLGLAFVVVLVLSACNALQQPPTPTPIVFPTPKPLPTHIQRPTSTPTTVAVAPTFTPTPTAEPARLTPSPTPRHTPQSGRLPGGYVETDGAPMLDSPGGAVIASLPAGARLGLLARDGGWLQARYQPDSKAKPLTGWVRLAQVAVFADLDELPGSVALEPEPEHSATIGEAPATTQTAGTVLPKRLNLRKGPGTNHPILDSLRSGETITLVGRTNDASWLEVETGAGMRGWVAARYVQTEVDAQTLPVTGKASTGAAAPKTTGGGKIVFQTRNDGDIYIMNSNGSGLKRLTRGFDPALSPDGKQVAFTRWDEPRGLWVINADGSGERHLFTTNEPRSPTWTADGSAIILEHATGTVRCLDTPIGCRSQDEVRQIFGDNDCLETPFGRFCISDYSWVTRSLGGLLSYNIADGSVRDLPTSNDANAPAADPSSDRVIYMAPGRLEITRSAGDEPPQRLLDLENPGPAVFSPDGRYIYTTRRSGDHWDIWRYRADGSGEVALTAPPGIRDAPVHSVAPTLSPDGRTILFLTNRRGKWELWRMDADGGNARPFAPSALAGIEFKYDFANERMVDWGG